MTLNNSLMPHYRQAALKFALFFITAALALVMPATESFAAAAAPSDPAEEYMQKQEYSKAAEVYSKLLQDDTDNVHLLFNYGTSLNFVNEQTRAVEVLSKCSALLEKKLAAKHDTVEAELLAHVYNNLSKCFVSLEKYDDAINACQLGLKRSAGLSWLYYNLGDALKQKGEPLKALDNFQKALALDPSDISSSLKIVECHYTMENFNEAGKILTELAKFYPENSEILFNLGSVYYKQNKADEAIKIWKAIAEREPESKFGRISKDWLSELKVSVDTSAKLMAETIECKLMNFAFLKPTNFYVAKFSESTENSIFMLSSHIYDETNKNTAEISLSVSAQALAEPQDYKRFAKEWQKNQASSGQNFELISEKEMSVGRGAKPGLIWEYGAQYNKVGIKGATAAFITNGYAVLIWLNATPSTFSKAVKDFYGLMDSFTDIGAAE